MFRKIAVGDIMTRHFTSVSPEANALECARKMIKEDVTSVLVVKNKKLLGILTQTNIIWALTKKPGLDFKTVNVMDLAARKVAVIKPSADISQAFQKMKRLGFRRLPVLSRGEVVGLLTIKDILRVEPEFYIKATSLLDIREEAQKLRRISHGEEEEEGFCDECGSFADLLKVEDRVLCQNCREELY